jgi:hypothetical protein
MNRLHVLEVKEIFIGWEGQYKLYFRECAVILEDLHHMNSRIGTLFFGMVGSESNINTLKQLSIGPLQRQSPLPKATKIFSFAREQDSLRKDVEPEFDMLQSCCTIVWHPAITWKVETMWEVMNDCIIMHNMIVEDGRDDSLYEQDRMNVIDP